MTIQHDNKKAALRGVALDLSLYPRSVSVEQVTEALGLQPEIARNEGSVRQSVRGQLRVERSWWFFHSKRHISSLDAGEHVDWLYKRYSERKAAFEAHIADSNPPPRMSLIWATNLRRTGHAIAPLQLRRLAAFGLAVNFMVWHLGEQSIKEVLSANEGLFSFGVSASRSAQASASARLVAYGAERHVPAIEATIGTASNVGNTKHDWGRSLRGAGFTESDPIWCFTSRASVESTVPQHHFNWLFSWLLENHSGLHAMLGMPGVNLSFEVGTCSDDQFFLQVAAEQLDVLGALGIEFVVDDTSVLFED
jgi:hypothetical protein